MSYDIYCYESKLGRPDFEEATAAIQINRDREPALDLETKLKIAKALVESHPKLEGLEFHLQEIAKLQVASIEGIKDPSRNIEIELTSHDLAIQILISDNSVGIWFTSFFSGDKNRELVNKITNYTKIVRQIAGFFVYDPQTGEVFDPLTKDIWA